MLPKVKLMRNSALSLFYANLLRHHHSLLQFGPQTALSFIVLYSSQSDELGICLLLASKILIITYVVVTSYELLRSTLDTNTLSLESKTPDVLAGIARSCGFNALT